MVQAVTYYATIVAFLLGTIYAAVDPQLCPDGATSTIPDPRWRPISDRFEIFTELSQAGEIIEISQAFALRRDAIFLTSKDASYSLYWNFIENEQFEVRNYVATGFQGKPICGRQEITGTSQTSVFTPNTLFVKPSILLGYNQVNQQNPNWGINYVEDTMIRGIPSKKFQSCFFLDDIQATVLANVYVSDANRSLTYDPNRHGVIMQIDVAVKNLGGRMEQFTYHVFRFTANPRRFEERQALETPASVYCENRNPGLPVPKNIPGRVSANSELYIPRLNNSIYSSHRLYDTEFEFTRLDLWFPDPQGSAAWLHFTEIHDFATGLSYRYEHATRQCNVGNITEGLNDAVPVDGNPNLVQISDPQHFFLLDDAQYQYTGEKRCRDRVLCHVWIAEKLSPRNTTEHREWYWASNINGQPLAQWIPMKLVFREYAGPILLNVLETTIFDFRRNPFTIFEVDYALADCYRAMGPALGYNLGVLSFRINNDKQYPVLTNLNYLRLHIWETLTFALYIRPIRISNIIVDVDGNDILVTFTLLDAPPTTGPVETPIQERSLDRLVERLERAINSNDLVFRARAGNKQVILRARPESLNVQHRSFEKVGVNTGGRITGLWIGFIVVGLVVGLVGGFFVFRKLATK